MYVRYEANIVNSDNFDVEDCPSKRRTKVCRRYMNFLLPLPSLFIMSKNEDMYAKSLSFIYMKSISYCEVRYDYKELFKKKLMISFFKN